MTTEATPPVEPAAPAATPPVAPPVATPPAAPPANAETPPGDDPAAAKSTDEGKEKTAVEGAPETYADFTLPNDGKLNTEVATAFKEAAKELNLPQDQAQALVTKLQPVMAAQQATAVEAVKAGWLESSKTDKEFGGDKLAENLALSKTAFDKFGTPELKTFLAESGLGNHPELVRWAVRVGKAMSNDTFVQAGRPHAAGGAEEARIQRMYGGTTQKAA